MIKIGKVSRITGKTTVVIALALGGGAVISSSAFAALTTVATGSNTVEAGTLLLQQDAASTGGTVSGGIGTAISQMAAGDTVNRYIDLTRAGNLDAQLPKLTLTADNTPLTNQDERGLYVEINQCDVAYDVTDGSCSGNESSALANTSAYSLTAGPVALDLDSTLAGATSHLKVSFTILQKNASTGASEEYAETTVNGDIFEDQSVGDQGTYNSGWGSSENSVQGANAVLSWVFSEELRTTTTTNS
ncbi:MAG: hypothetical protein K9G05_02155 [Candidatus Nanopelagicales bacterium]|nr:hypothetical protein [Candidatus Nanopelagicales bacterium]MCF8539681.1 hypothetical protein [Candidatus Nanopelagicales bacterium]MCF8550868.1 hypothetical protein [Candidatus Nanopelagicales bacterium]